MTTIRPPGRATRFISRKGRRRVRHMVETVARQHDVESPVRKWQASRIANMPFKIVEAYRCLSLTRLPDHRRCEIDTSDVCGLHRSRAGDDPGPAGDVQETTIGPDRGSRERTSHAVTISVNGKLSEGRAQRVNCSTIFVSCAILSVMRCSSA